MKAKSNNKRKLCDLVIQHLYLRFWVFQWVKRCYTKFALQIGLIFTKIHRKSKNSSFARGNCAMIAFRWATQSRFRQVELLLLLLVLSSIHNNLRGAAQNQRKWAATNSSKRQHQRRQQRQHQREQRHTHNNVCALCVIECYIVELVVLLNASQHCALTRFSSQYDKISWRERMHHDRHSPIVCERERYWECGVWCVRVVHVKKTFYFSRLFHKSRVCRKFYTISSSLLFFLC